MNSFDEKERAAVKEKIDTAKGKVYIYNIKK